MCSLTHSTNNLPNGNVDAVVNKPYRASDPAKDTNVSPLITRVKRKIILVL